MIGRALYPLLLWLAAGSAAAADRTYLEVSPAGSADLVALLGELEASLEDGLPQDTQPVVVILHGSEALPFTSAGYASHRDLVDRAARLDAYRLIDVRMCETWMSRNGIEKSDIPAFIETIPYAPEEIRRLETEGYLPYGSIDL
jgi:intracellular sulfur oxidation DsrE/DsrF family protein